MTTSAAAGRPALELARASYREIALYAPNREPCAVDLSDNTNLWGIPPAAERAIREAAVSTVTRYPPLYAADLKSRLAAYLGVAPEMVVTGCGSDDVLDSAIRAVAEPGDRIAFPDPSFAMIPIFARMNGLVPVPVPMVGTGDWAGARRRRAGGTGGSARRRELATPEPASPQSPIPSPRIDPEALVDAKARVIYLCSPNNPTGNALSRAAIEYVVERAPGAVILDEAYAEYAERHHLDLLARSERLLVTRTMSKAFGLAGLRVGYAAGSPDFVAEVEKSRGPYKVSALAERAAAAALAEDLPWVRARVAEAKGNRERLTRTLVAMGYEVVPSQANFVLVFVDNAPDVARALRARGVAVRPFEQMRGLGDALRVSVGPWEMMEAFLTAFAEVRPCG